MKNEQEEEDSIDLYGMSKKMKITLITVGKIKEKYLKDAIAEYSKRLSKYCKLTVIEAADEKTPDQARLLANPQLSAETKL